MFRSGVLAGLMVLLAGCTAPPPLTQEDMIDAAELRRDILQQRLNDVGDELTLPQALAWALDNNLEFRLRAFDAAMATGNRKLANLSMLPALTARAGYRNRSNISASVSESVSTGLVSLEPSTSSDKEGHSYDLEMSWNVLDFSLAWFRAREFGEQALIAEEERRRVLQQLSIELIFAWDKALAYQRMREDITQSRQQLLLALDQSEQILNRRLQDQVGVLEYRAALLLILKRINQLGQEMNQAQDELARLLALPAGVDLPLPAPLQDREAVAPLPEMQVEEAQWQALLRRPEMKQALYHARNADRDAVRRLLEAFPSLIFSYGTNYDSNSFLVNNRWDDTGVNLSWNLINLASLPGRHRLGKLGKQSAQARIDLQATAILTQVVIADKAVTASRLEYCLSDKLEEVDDRKLAMLQARASAAALDNLTLVRAKVNNLLIKLESALDRAEYRRAQLLLASSIGISAVPESYESEDLAGKAEEIESWINGGMQAELAALRAEAKQDSSEGEEGVEVTESPLPDASDAMALEMPAPEVSGEGECALL